VTDVGMMLVTVARISRLESFVASEQLLTIDDRLSELLLLLLTAVDTKSSSLLLTVGKTSRLLLISLWAAAAAVCKNKTKNIKK